ncbi:MAG: S46 family peptidase, partial [Saprospiraceae bacterium]|nr:S46 family peptidase [Saprospiraceae bacterium]
MKNIKLICFILFLFQSSDFIAQEKEASPFDFGRMWTFENPPIDWFKEAYGIDADQAWFDDVRKSSLRFASWCSASFVSPNGLIMTNHHCSRDVAISVQNEGENFDNNGFYAEALADERRVDDLFVEQLIRVDDITDIVKAESMSAENDTERAAIEAQAIEDIKADYQNRKDWMHLRLQVVSFYSGGKYSIYGYKKFSDIRLVLIPENDLGFYGGDPDNFTYPRYNLDFTFWRAYDENGEPLNTSANYYEFNIDGIEEGTPVFVVGNPGSTERY